MVTEFNFAREQAQMTELDTLTKKYSKEQIDEHILKNDKICIICMDKERSTVIQPCGHVLCCEDCIKLILKKSSVALKARCPICRVNISSYGKFIIS